MSKFDISEFRNQIDNLLYGNKYTVELTKLDSTKLELLARKVDIPQIDFQMADADIGGQLVGTPVKIQPGELIVTFFNTGDEFLRLKAFANEIFNQDTRCFRYYDDIKMDIVVTEYNSHGDAAWKIKFMDCILTNLSTISMTYEESSQPEEFSASFRYAKDSTEKITSGDTTKTPIPNIKE